VIGNDVHGNQRPANDNPTSFLRVLRGSGSAQELVNVDPAGGLLITSTRPTLNR